MNLKIHWDRVVALVFGVIMVLGSGIFTCYQIFKIFQTKQDVKAQEAFLTSANYMLNSTAIPNRDELVKVKQKLNAFEEIVPSKQEDGGLLDYLEIKAIESNIQVIAIKFEEEELNDDYIQQPLRISLHGEYTSIMNYITQLRDGIRPFRVSEFLIEREGQDGLGLYCELLIYAFYQKLSD